MAKPTAQAVSDKPWFQEFLTAFTGGESPSFLMHTGAHDLERPGVSVSDFLAHTLVFSKFEVVALFSVSKGIHFPALFDQSGAPIDMTAMRKRFFEIVGQDDPDPAQPIIVSPEVGVTMLLEFLRKSPAQKSAVIIERLDNIVGELVPVDASVIATMEMLHDAGTDRTLEGHGCPLIMLAPRLEEIRTQVRDAASNMKIIEIPLPDAAARLAFAKARMQFDDMADLKLVGLTIEQLAHLTAGLMLRHVENMMMRAALLDGQLTRSLALSMQREMMDQQFGGIVKRIDRPFTLEDIGGLVEAKAHAERRVIAPLKAGRYDQAPTAILYVGPPGTGKTMLATAMANDSGLNCLECDLSTLMTSEYGGTEKKVAEFKRAAIANAPTIVFMDEIDQKVRRGEGGSDPGGGGAAENRLFAAILELVGDTSLWRKLGVTWVFACNRPDLVDDALMSRMQAVIPLLPAETDAARADVMGRLIKRLSNGTRNVSSEALVALAATVQNWSNRDLEQVVQDALATAEIEQIAFNEALTETIKWRRADTKSVAAQIKAAVDACKDLRLIPERYRTQTAAATPSAAPASEWGVSGKKIQKISWGEPPA
jgi:SpoVK/Ycf46/Vps4 family AAA+-type ATPase